MKKFGALLLPLLLILVVGLAACGKTPGTTGDATKAPGNEVQMDAVSFLQTTLTIKAGTSVNFDDPADSGGTHIICSGANGTCDNSAAAPADLQKTGFNIDAGQSKQVMFDKAGTYKITCSIHPDMNLTITVQ